MSWIQKTNPLVDEGGGSSTARGKEMRKMRMKLGNHGTPWREGHAVGEGWAVRSLDCVCVCRPNGQGVSRSSARSCNQLVESRVLRLRASTGRKKTETKPAKKQKTTKRAGCGLGRNLGRSLKMSDRVETTNQVFMFSTPYFTRL